MASAAAAEDAAPPAEVPATPTTRAAADTTLHRAVYEGDLAKVQDMARTCAAAELNARDRQGNTPLLLAIMLGRTEMVQVLLAHGADATAKTRRKWPALAEAISIGDRDLARVVLVAVKRQIKSEIRRKTEAIVAALEAIKDFYMEIDFEFHSWVPLVSRVLPSDTLRLWKKGQRIRLDSTLLNVSEQTIERGERSVVIEPDPDAKGTFRAVNINRSEKTYSIHNLGMSDQDSEEDRTESEPTQEKSDGVAEDEELEEELSLLLQSDINDVDSSPGRVSFTRATSGWLGWKTERSEDVSGYTCRVYNVNNVTIQSRIRREHLSEEDVRNNKAISRKLKEGSMRMEEMEVEFRPSLPPPERTLPTWDEYAAAPEYIHLGRPLKQVNREKVFSATVWMSDDFPLPLVDIVGLIEVLLPSAKHVARLRSFMSTKMPAGSPVKVHIPVFPTVTARITFSRIHNEPVKNIMFAIPPGFTEEVEEEEGIEGEEAEPARLRSPRRVQSPGPRTPLEGGGGGDGAGSSANGAPRREFGLQSPSPQTADSPPSVVQSPGDGAADGATDGDESMGSPVAIMTPAEAATPVEAATTASACPPHGEESDV